MDIFKRNKRKSTRHSLLGALLLIVGLILAGYGYNDYKQKLENPRVYQEDQVNTSDYYTVNIDWFSDLVAYYGDTEDSADTKFYFGYTDQEEFILVRAGSKAAEKIEQAPTNTDDFLEEPMTMVGTFSELDSDMKAIIKEQWAYFNDIDIESLEDDISQTNFSFTEGSLAFQHSMFVIIGILLGIIGFILLFIGWFGKRNYKKYQKEFKETYPDLKNYQDIDRDAQLSLDRSGVVLYEPFLFSDKAPMGMVDLQQIDWAYISKETVNKVTKINLNLRTHDGKKKQFLLKGPLEKAQEELEPLFEYLAENYPEMRLGYSSEY